MQGRKVLSIENAPQEQWEELGLQIPAPDYEEEAYNTKYCPITDTEFALFNNRLIRRDPKMRSVVRDLMGVFGQVPRSDDDMMTWLEEKMFKNAPTDLLDMRQFASYDPKFGFKISVDGFHNTPQEELYATIVSLNPPGILYQNTLPAKALHVHVVTDWDFDSPLRSFKYSTDYMTFRDVSAGQSLAAILDVRKITFINGQVQALETAWTAVPIFFL